MGVEMLSKICVPCGKTDSADNFDSQGDHVKCEVVDRLRHPLQEHEIGWARPGSATFQQLPGQIKSGVQDKEQQQRFSMPGQVEDQLLNWLLRYTIDIYIDFTPEIESDFYEFCAKKSVNVPVGMLSTAPKVNGVGPCGGTVVRGGVQGKIWFEVPSDKSILKQIEKQVKEVTIGRGKNRRAVCLVNDSKLVLKLIVDYGFPITKWIKSRRRRIDS
jgi:hypothetical protein